MRAFAMTDSDAVPALTDLDVPEPAEGEVRVRIRAASVNGFDLAVAAGHTKKTVTVVPVFANPTLRPSPGARPARPNGETAVAIQEVFCLEQVQAALDAFTQGTLGKVVITTD
jgi:hypothetical protein